MEKNTKWIMANEFANLTPLDILHKENEEIKIPPHDKALKNFHMLVRKNFTLQTLKPAVLKITADDYYKLYINGQFVAQGPAPGYHFNYNYNTIDIEKYLQVGENTIAVHVHYMGVINRVLNSGDLRQGLIAQLEMDGKIILSTDRSWKYCRAKAYTSTRTTGNETQFIEDFDSRLEEKGWMLPDFDDTSWQMATEVETDHILVQQTTDLVDVYEIKPASVSLINDNFLIDFGQEITGRLKVRARGERGQEITIMYGEEMDGDIPRHQMRCNCDYLDTWTLSGEEDDLNQYDYKAFRYVAITAQSVIKSSLAAEVRHYPLDESACVLTTNNQLLQDIWRICANAIKYGTQEGYLDCPSREKGQYLGDSVIIAHAQAYLSGDLSLFRKVINDFALSAKICPGLMAVAPGSHMQEIADYSLLWPYLLLTYYKFSNDIAFLQEMLPIAEGILKHFDQYKRPDGLIESALDKWNLIDWPANLRDDYDFDERGPGCHNVINAFYIGAVKNVGQIKRILEIPTNEDDEKFESLRASFIREFFKSDLGLFTDTKESAHTAVHSNTLPLFFGLQPENATSTMVELIKQKGFSCGVYHSYFLLKGLAAVGEHELVYDLLTNQSERSWANMLREGATTCFEAWGVDQKWNTSLCHPWASSPIIIMIEDLIPPNGVSVHVKHKFS